MFKGIEWWIARRCRTSLLGATFSPKQPIQSTPPPPAPPTLLTIYDFSFLLLAYFHIFSLFFSLHDGWILGMEKRAMVGHRRPHAITRRREDFIFDLLLLAMADDNAGAFQFLPFFPVICNPEYGIFIWVFFLLFSLAGFMRRPGASTAVPDPKLSPLPQPRSE